MPSGRERWAARAAHTRWTMPRRFTVHKAKWTPTVKPEQGCGDSTWQSGNRCCFTLSGYNMENLPQRGWGALPCSPAIATTKYQREARQKMTFKCRIQLCSSHPHESPFHWLDHFLSLLEPAQGFGEYVQPGNGKKSFHCFKNGKQLLLSQSFIVSSTNTLHKSCKGWRQEQESNKRNTNDKSRLSSIHWGLLVHLEPIQKAEKWYGFRIIFQWKLQNTTKKDTTKGKAVFNRKYELRLFLHHIHMWLDHILLGYILPSIHKKLFHRWLNTCGLNSSGTTSWR